MANFNHRGPLGEGPMTGRKMGRCTNFGARLREQTMDDNENRENAVNLDAQGLGLGRGRGRGMGRGIRNRMSNDSIEQGQAYDMTQNRAGRGMRQGGIGRGNIDGRGRGKGMGRGFRNDI